MANGLTDHAIPPHAMQLRPMLRGEGAKGNGKGQILRLGVGCQVQLQVSTCHHKVEY